MNEALLQWMLSDQAKDQPMIASINAFIAGYQAGQEELASVLCETYEEILDSGVELEYLDRLKVIYQLYHG
jgi:hypothetical protein